jgi:uncharacterized membrane protein
MSFPQIRLLPLHCFVIFSLSTTSLLFGQTPTPTPPPDTDGDGVPDHQDGWPLHKQLKTPRVPDSKYIAIDLGPGTGYAINNLGDVVGEAENDYEREAVLWRLGQPPTFLGFLTQDQTVGRSSIAWGINDARQITGSSTYSWDPNVSGEYPDPPTYPMWDYHSSVHAFRWQTGTMTELSDLSVGQAPDPSYPDPTGKGYSLGWAINRYGVVAGQSDNNLATQNIGSVWHLVHYTLRAVRFDAPAPSDLGIISPDGVTEALAINDHGAIVGSLQGYSEAFFQVNGQTQSIAPYSGVSIATGLNNLDHVVGVSGDSTKAFIWIPTSNLSENERVIDLGALSQEANFVNTSANAINDRDQIVGSGRFGLFGVLEPLLWQNGELHRLNDLIGSHPDFHLISATAINQNGMIVANGSNGKVFLLVPNELMVDANNDGKMSFTNAAVHNKDKTKKHAPYQFWVNDDRDEGEIDIPTEGQLDWTKNVIDEVRDLEDFQRLWISFKGLTELVKSAGVQLQLEWQPNDGTLPWRPAEGNPAIKLFPAAEPDGGRKYLDKQNWATLQASSPYNATYGLVRRDFPLVLPLGPDVLGNLTEEQPNLYFLFEGVDRGKGRLVLKLLKNGQPLAEYPPLYMEIKDVKDMYERWTVGDVTEPNTSVFSSLDYQVWPTDTPVQKFGLSERPMSNPTTEAEKDYILLVHGWNSSPFSKGYVGDTAFKRLYWQGFKGRFGLFRWPTFYFEGDLPPVHHFDASEHRAWQSSLGLLSLINQLNGGPFAGRVRIIAHSMGNIVVGEALRRSQSGQIIHTYIASQAAISAHCYDATATAMPFRLNLGPTTPDVYGFYWQNGATSQPHQWESENRPSYMHSDYMLGKAGSYFNYYNDRDAALDWPLWQLDQQTKPDHDYGYRKIGLLTARGFYRDPGQGPAWLTFPIDRYEIFAWAVESHSFALGTQFVNGVVTASGGKNVNLRDAPYNYRDGRKFHSGQFYDSNAQRGDYWKEVMSNCRLIKVEE